MKTPQDEIEALLQKSGLKRTHARKEALLLMKRHGKAISHGELEKQLSHLMNRVTVYRVMSDLQESGLIHKVFDSDGLIHFALCQEHCHTHRHNDTHAHFSCLQCKSTLCLEELPWQAPMLPPHFQLKDVHLTLTGLCADCSLKV